MSFANARSQYKQAETGNLLAVEDPHEIILVTLRELERSLLVLSASQAAGSQYPGTHLNRAFTAIYILQSCLDFERGGEIATTLFQVYEFCRLQVALAFSRTAGAQLPHAAECIGGLLTAWSQIGPGSEKMRA